MPFDPSFLLFGAAVASLLLFQINIRRASPVLAILNRWLRWIVFSLSCALVLSHYQVVDRPYWVIATACFLLWFLAETVYVWFAIHALSESEIPLFPRFGVNLSGDEWPTQPRFLKMREELRAAGFRPVQALRAEPIPGMSLRMSVYQNADATIRAQITFLPHAGGAIATSFSFSSLTADGRRIVTDNMHLPFGGFYPENWAVARHPWIRSWSRLLNKHQVRVREAGAALPWETEPLVDVNAQQHELDQVNTQLGFLVPPEQREDFGKMSHEGRYRVWKEVWLLNYLGRSSRYE
ncbi:MAG: hypothetical protein SFV32_01990 [Opitutaceae bacterium]|nr:hypothetical protein [Opitutaceae bacterium]